jgi:hypothetical protein
MSGKRNRNGLLKPKDSPWPVIIARFRMPFHRAGQ